MKWVFIKQNLEMLDLVLYKMNYFYQLKLRVSVVRQYLKLVKI